jgi:hypothetical protein
MPDAYTRERPSRRLSICRTAMTSVGKRNGSGTTPPTCGV